MGRKRTSQISTYALARNIAASDDVKFQLNGQLYTLALTQDDIGDTLKVKVNDVEYSVIPKDTLLGMLQPGQQYNDTIKIYYNKNGVAVQLGVKEDIV